MILRVHIDTLEGNVTIPCSKSEAHRALICAALSNTKTKILMQGTNNDIKATISCLEALGARFEHASDGILVSPLSSIQSELELDVGESGSTLRFMLPVLAACGLSAHIHLHGRLAKRPLDTYKELLSAHGVELQGLGSDELTLRGKLSSKSFELPGNISSQFISGLLLAAPLMESDVTIALTTALESSPYVHLTSKVLGAFGVNVSHTLSGDSSRGETFVVENSRYCSPLTFQVSGDWSNAAFWLVAQALGAKLCLLGLDLSSAQGDRFILEILQKAGAELQSSEPLQLHATSLSAFVCNAKDIPDLVPPLCLLASCSEGLSTIYGTERLTLKESNRIESICAALSSLGAQIEGSNEKICVQGKAKLLGGRIDAHNDHRIAMMAAIAALVSKSDVIIDGAECVAKSYPSFFEELKRLGAFVSEVNS